MSKDKFIKQYMIISMLFIIGFIIIVNMFLNGFPVDPVNYQYGFNGTIESNLWEVSFISHFETISVQNYPLIVSGVLLLINGLVTFYAFRNGGTEAKIISETMMYNTVITLIMTISSLLMMLLIPEVINGVIENSFFMTKIPIMQDEIATIYNPQYFLSVVYIILNIFVLFYTKEKKFKPEKEKTIDREDLLL